MTLLCWVLALALVFRFLFGAGVSTGWIVAGAVISLAAACGWLLTRELKDTIRCRARFKAVKAADPSVKAFAPRPARPRSPKRSKRVGGSLPRRLAKAATAGVKQEFGLAIALHLTECPRRKSLGLRAQHTHPANRRRKAIASWLANQVSKRQPRLIDRLQPVRL